MLIIGHTRADQCKMRAIDTSSWNKPEIDGNLIKWFKYTGVLFLVSGAWANCTIGACPATLRTCSPGVGGALADILAGICGKIVLLAIYLITLLCNLIGYFWIYLAKMARTPENSKIPGDMNYCAAEVWITAQIVVIIFWVISSCGALMVCAQIHRFFRSEEARLQPVYLGKSKQNDQKTKRHKEEV